MKTLEKRQKGKGLCWNWPKGAGKGWKRLKKAWNEGKDERENGKERQRR